MAFLILNVAEAIQNDEEIITNYQECALKLWTVISPIWRHLLKAKLKRILVRNAITQISVSQHSVADSQIVSKGSYILENGTGYLMKTCLFQFFTPVFSGGCLTFSLLMQQLERLLQCTIFFFPICPRRGVSRI